MSGGAPPSKNPITTHREISRNPTKLDSLSNLPSCLFFLSQPRQQSALFQRAAVPSRTRTRWRPGALSSGEGVDGRLPSPESGQLGFDSLLSVAEVLCVAPPAVYSIGCFVGFMLPGGPKLFHLPLGNRVVVWQLLLLAGAVAIGSLIRRRQWQRICRVNSIGSGVDLIGRIQKLEEDTRNSAMIVRVLSRQLEKLGIKFRVTRKTLKDPIAETAALAQKNSEATRILALQEDILEKELGEIQKVLLAMQEQQRKQLELILAIGKAGRLVESKHDAAAEQSPIRNNVFIPEKNSAAAAVESYSNQKQ